VEDHGRGMNQGTIKYRFVLEVQPSDGEAFRVMLDHVFLYSDVVPERGASVNVEYEVKHPDKAKLKLDGDPHYDRKLVKEHRKEQEDATRGAAPGRGRSRAGDRAAHHPVRLTSSIPPVEDRRAEHRSSRGFDEPVVRIREPGSGRGVEPL